MKKQTSRPNIICYSIIGAFLVAFVILYIIHVNKKENKPQVTTEVKQPKYVSMENEKIIQRITDEIKSRPPHSPMQPCDSQNISEIIKAISDIKHPDMELISAMYERYLPRDKKSNTVSDREIMDAIREFEKNNSSFDTSVKLVTHNNDTATISVYLRK